MSSPMKSVPATGVTRRDFLCGLGAFVASQVFIPPVLGGVRLDPGLKPLRLGFLTDCHAMAEKNAPAWLDRTAELMNSLKTDLIIGGGDFVHGGFSSSGKTMDQRWVIASAFLRKLKVRLEPLIGNHDFYEPLTPGGKIAAHDPRSRWKQHFKLPATYRSFQFHGYRFLMLDSIKVVGGENPYRGWIDRAQLDWLDHELKRIPINQPIILCSHIPFRSSLVDSFEAMVLNAPGRVRVLNADRVLEKLRHRPVIAILQGHIHRNERLILRGIPCITGGAVCGNWWEGENMGTYPGLGLLEIIPWNAQKGKSPKEIAWSYFDTPPPTSSAARKVVS